MVHLNIKQNMSSYKNTLPILVLMCAAVKFASAQKGNPESLPVLIENLARYNVYETSEMIGFAGSISRQYARYQQLGKVATIAELEDLAGNHKNPVVRLYALQALRHKLKVIPPALLEKFKQDYTVVVTMHGCIAGKLPVNQLAGPL